VLPGEVLDQQGSTKLLTGREIFPIICVHVCFPHALVPISLQHTRLVLAQGATLFDGMLKWSAISVFWHKWRPTKLLAMGEAS